MRYTFGQTWRRLPASNVPYWSTSPFSLCLSIAIHILLVLLAFVNTLCTENKGKDLPITTIIDLLTAVTKRILKSATALSVGRIGSLRLLKPLL